MSYLDDSSQPIRIPTCLAEMKSTFPIWHDTDGFWTHVLLWWQLYETCPVVRLDREFSRVDLKLTLLSVVQQ